MRRNIQLGIERGVNLDNLQIQAGSAVKRSVHSSFNIDACLQRTWTIVLNNLPTVLAVFDKNTGGKMWKYGLVVYQLTLLYSI